MYLYVFLKYRVSFRLDKCDFLKTQVEYVGHEVTKAGNCPAQSKFDVINYWTLPPTGKFVFSFIGLANFYHRHAPYFGIWLKPLRKFLKQYYHKPIPLMEWTPELITLFSGLKNRVTSYTVLTRFDPDKPTLLKTYWRSEVMGWILM